MKSISSVIKQFLPVLCSTLLITTGCKKDLLNTTPYSSIGSGNMWTTDNLTDLGVGGVYSALKIGTSTGGVSRRELYHYDRLVTSQWRSSDALTNGTATANESLFANVWQDLYEGVHRANEAIDGITRISPSTPEKKARLVAEMKFMRAYYYLRLNQLYKGVPVFTQPVTETEVKNTARSSEADVWQQVITDLTEAIQEPNLPVRYDAAVAAQRGFIGHASKSAAYALRGKAYMYTKEWDKAIADFDEVKKAGHVLWPNYSTLFDMEQEQNPEMIFSIQYQPISGGFGSTTQFYCGTRSSFGSCWTEFNVNPDIVDEFDNLDGSPFNWDLVIPGYAAMNPESREVFFLRNNASAGELNAAATRGAATVLYLPVGNEERIKAAFANRDPRLAAQVITPYSDYLGRDANNDGSDDVFTLRWPYRNENPLFDINPDTRTLGYYLHRKFVYKGSNTFYLADRVSGGIDFPLIRYADVLLMWAEALNEAGDLNTAIEKVNEVRSRAGVGLLNSSAATTVADKDALTTRIRKERRIEFLNEGISYFDELRWKTLKETSYAQGSGAKEMWGSIKRTFSNNWPGDFFYAWPVPAAEIQRAPVLTQNPGWPE